MVLLYLFLLLPVLHILRNDDGFHLTKPTSCRSLGCNLLFTLQPVLRLLHYEKSEFHLFYNNTTLFTSYLCTTNDYIDNIFAVGLQRIPAWWVWYYWICPLAWTVYGIIITQYGDLEDIIKVSGQPDQTIKFYIKDHFGYDTDFIGVVAAVLVGFSVFFAFTFAFCIRTLNFQQR